MRAAGLDGDGEGPGLTPADVWGPRRAGADRAPGRRRRERRSVWRERFAAARDRARREIEHDLAEGRGFLWLPVALMAGIALWFALPSVPIVAAIAGAAGLIAVAVRADRAGRPSLLLAAAATGAIGWLAAEASTALSEAPRLGRPWTGVVAGHLMAVEDRESRGIRVLVAVHHLESYRRGRAPLRVQVIVRGPVPDGLLRPGAAVRLKARLAPPSPPLYPGGYDFARVAWFDRIGATGFTIAPPEPWADSPPAPGLLRAWAEVESVRQQVATRVRATLPGDTGAIAAALMVGDRGAIDAETDRAMQVSGLSHVLSISGLHMSLVAFGLFKAVRLLVALWPRAALEWPVKRWAAGAALVGAGLYLLVSGMSVATVRSAAMVALACVAVMVDRRPFSLRLVAVAALVVFAVDPVSVLEPGAQMSFISVAALIAAYEGWREARPMGDPPDVNLAVRVATAVGLWTLGCMATSLIAGLATGPIALYHFGRLAPLGIVSNLLATPVIAFLIMPAGVMSAIAMPFGLDGWTLPAMGLGIDIMIAIAVMVADWTPGGGSFGRPSLAGTLLMVAGGLWLMLWTGRVRFAGLALVAAGLVLAPLERAPDLVVSGTGRRVLYADPSGRLHVLGRADAFETNLWLAARGAPPARETDTLSDGVRCDAEACVLAEDGRAAAGKLGRRRKGAGQGERQEDAAGGAATGWADPGRPGRRSLIALVRQPAAFADECATARLVVTPLVAPRWCRALTTVIDRTDLAATGARTYAVEPGDGAAGPPADAARSGRRRNAGPDGRLRLVPLDAAISDPRRPWHPAPDGKADRDGEQVPSPSAGPRQ
nr:ComEC/Rec2 family competence protein [Chthonobacter rhizosphaerae]